MHGKKKTCRTILIIGLLFFLFGSHVYAEEVLEGLPEIVRWEDGGGFDGAGNRITQGRAYDAVSEAGRYVLFDENGMVQKKADSWESREKTGEYFTFTEQETGTIALRAVVFDGFEGEISVMVEEEKSTAKKYILSPDNLYEFNIPAHSGGYRIQKAEAADSSQVYLVEYSKEPFRIEENGMILCSIQVTDQIAGEVWQEQQDTPVIEDNILEEENAERRQAVQGKETVSRRDNIGNRGTGMAFSDLKYLFLGAGMVVILAAGLFLRSRKNKYH